MAKDNPANKPDAATATVPCRVAAIVVPAQPTTYSASPGTIQFRIQPGTGTIAFDVLNCAVRESNGTVVPINPNATPATLSFPVAKGKSYTFSAAYIVNSNATATLVEDCKGQTFIDDLNALQAAGGRTYPIVVA